MKRIPRAVFIELSSKNTSLKGECIPISEGYIIRLYTKNIEDVQDAMHTIAHEVLHILEPQATEEEIEQKTPDFAQKKEFLAWLSKKLQESQLFAMLFRKTQL